MKALKLAALAAFFGIVGFGFWSGLKGSDLTKVETIVFQGASPQTEARLRKILPVKPGDLLWSVSVEKIAQILKSDSWVESAEVRRQFPHTLIVTVNERKPLAVLNNGRGVFKYVDGNDNILGGARTEDIGPYPVLSGASFQTNKDLREQAIALLKSLPENGPVSLADISDVRFDDEHGYRFTLTNSGILVDVGKEDVPLHIDRARKVIQYLTAHNINALHVDSDYAKKVLVKVNRGR